MLNYEQFYSLCAKGMKKSEIREILKLISKPGGVPNYTVVVNGQQSIVNCQL